MSTVTERVLAEVDSWDAENHDAVACHEDHCPLCVLVACASRIRRAIHG